MRRRAWSGIGAVLVAACGGSGGSGGSGGGVPVVTAPAPTPTPAPTATPTPAPSYPTYAQLTGDQSFRTGCGALTFDASPPQARPVSPFGSGLTLGYSAASQTYTVSADAATQGYFGQQARSYGPADRDPAAPAGVVGYLRTTNGFQERLTIGTPNAGGTAPDYLRGLSLRTPQFGNPGPGAPAVQASCVFGVPTRIDDAPRTGGVVRFTRTGFNGVAYAQPTGGGLETYALHNSQVTLSVDLSSYRVTTAVRLVGVLQTAAGPAATPTELGTYTSSIPIDEAGYYNGLLSSADRTVQSATFGGWFFGPQGVEAGYAVSILARDEATGRRLSAIGNAVALR